MNGQVMALILDGDADALEQRAVDAVDLEVAAAAPEEEVAVLKKSYRWQKSRSRMPHGGPG